MNIYAKAVAAAGLCALLPFSVTLFAQTPPKSRPAKAASTAPLKQATVVKTVPDAANFAVTTKKPISIQSR